jgi:hypothetical protein
MYKLKVLVDASVLFDWIFEIESSYVNRHAARVIGLCVQQGKIQGYLTAHAFYDVGRAINERFDPTKADERMQFLYRSFEILKLDRELAVKALGISVFEGFEDSLLAYSADAEKIDFVITRDAAKFQGLMDKLPKSKLQQLLARLAKANASKIKVLSPEGFLRLAENIGREIDLVDSWGLVYQDEEDSQYGNQSVSGNANFDHAPLGTNRGIVNANYVMQRRKI